MAFALRRLIRPAVQSTIAARSTIINLSPQHKNVRFYASDAPPKPSDASDQKLIVSDSCIKRLHEICQDGSFLRITVEGGGCSGFQYKFDLDTKQKEDDLEFGEGQAKVVIDNVSLEYCAGATIDYHTELIRSGFRMLANPQAEQGCSCGASFAIKLD